MPSPCTLKSPPAAHRLPPIAPPPPTVRPRQRISANGVNATPSGVSICRCFLCSPNCADLISCAARSPHPNEVSPPHPLPGPIAPPCATAAAAVTLSTAAGPRRSSGVPQPWNLHELNLPPRFHALHSATSMEHAPLFRLGSRVPHSNAFPPDLHPRIRAILTFYFPPLPLPLPIGALSQSLLLRPPPSSTLLHSRSPPSYILSASA